MFFGCLLGKMLFEKLNFASKTHFMIRRIVKMTFAPDKIEEFKEIFKNSKEKIRGRAGCHHLELWQDAKYPNIFFTYSHWESEDFLNAYRHSALFKGVWKDTKALFAARPEAWSLEVAG